MTLVQKTLPIAQTSTFKRLNTFFDMERTEPNGIRALTGNSGIGKSTTINHYCLKHAGAIYARCYKQMQYVHLLKIILTALGKSTIGPIYQLYDNVVAYLEQCESPLLIIDEADKLNDSLIQFFIDLENRLHQKCGIVFLATKQLKTKIEAGVIRQKQGYPELYSRMRCNIIDITPNKKEFAGDVTDICNMYGITDTEVITEFFNSCENDLRSLDDLIMAYRKKYAA